MRTCLLLALVALGPVLGCSGGGGPLSPAESRALSSGEQRWRSGALTSYSYEGRVSCFCPPDLNQWAVVEVRGGRVAGVRLLDGTVLPADRWQGRPTVDEMFALIRRAPSESWVRDVVLEFDGTLGYPRLIDLRSKPNIADAASRHDVRNLKPL